MKNQQAPLKTYLRTAGIIAILFGIFLFVVVFLLTSKAFHPSFDYSSTGQVGDTLGGITAPFIGVSGAILTFLAFFMQFKANEIHNLQFDLQSQEKTREKHENRILYLVQQNRDIAQTMTIGESVVGPKCFARMFTEFRAAYEICKSIFRDELSEGDLLNVSYAIFHNGIGPASNILNRKLFHRMDKLDLVFSIFDSLQNEKDVNRMRDIKRIYNIEFNERQLLELEYMPFDGHTTRLGQYFRNLFHVLTYTSGVDKDLISDDEKREIIKTLRSQLSSYEQILIYFNSLSLYGQPLREKGFIEFFSLIKNIPIPLVDFAGDIHSFYPEIDFEWDEVIRRTEANHITK